MSYERLGAPLGVSWWSQREVMGAFTDLGFVACGEVWEDSGGNEFVLVWKWEVWKRVREV